MPKGKRGNGKKKVVLSNPNGLPEKASKQISKLQGDLSRANDKRLEERFGWIAISSFLGIALISASVPLQAWIVLAPLYLIFLVVCADRCGVDDVKYALSNLLSWVLNRFGSKDK